MPGETKTDKDTKQTEGETKTDENGDGAGSEVDVEAIVKSAVTAATEAANTTADKRINQFIEKFEKSQPKGEGDDDGSKDQGQDAANRALEERLTRTQRKLLTAAVRDEVKRLDEPVQATALQMAKAVTDRMTITDDMDEDEIAVEVVTLVEEQLDTAKETFETALREDYKSRGLLKDDDGDGGGQGPKDGDDGTSKTDPVKQMEAGAEAAKKHFGTDKKE